MVAVSDFTEAELSALRRAYANGTLRVTVGDRTVEYGSAEDLLSRIREIERSLTPSGQRPKAGYAGFSRGFK